MVQSFDLPVLSLAIPNIEKMDTTNTDNISCLWTVFSKCKDNLEHGKRLENLSWRVWYRERSATQNKSRISPVPIQASTKQEDSFDNTEHLSSNSFKRLISSLDNKFKLPQKVSHHTSLPNDIPQKKEMEKEATNTRRVKKFFIRDDDDESDDEGLDTSVNDDQPVALLPVYDDDEPLLDAAVDQNIETHHVNQHVTTATPHHRDITQNNKRKSNHCGYKAALGKKLHQYKKKSSFVTPPVKSSPKQQEQLIKKFKLKETCLDFQKQKPVSILPKGPSLLSNMLHQSRDHSSVPPVKISDELSCSMKECLSWEHRNNILHPSYTLTEQQFNDQTQVW
ncbi:DUF1752-domain-containing protein [Backusella circina FSU 941]|nr:DUF1752-domain-containing protein [Backusella circina FSU 941]